MERLHRWLEYEGVKHQYVVESGIPELDHGAKWYSIFVPSREAFFGTDNPNGVERGIRVVFNPTVDGYERGLMDIYDKADMYYKSSATVDECLSVILASKSTEWR